MNELHLLTPNQEQRLIKEERKRRRLMRYTQVQRQSVRIAQKIREQVKNAVNEEIEVIRGQISDSVVRKTENNGVLSPIQYNGTIEEEYPRRRRRKLNKEDEKKATERYIKATKRIKKEREMGRKKTVEVSRKRNEAIKDANIRSKQFLEH